MFFIFPNKLSSVFAVIYDLRYRIVWLDFHANFGNDECVWFVWSSHSLRFFLSFGTSKNFQRKINEKKKFADTLTSAHIQNSPQAYIIRNDERTALCLNLQRLFFSSLCLQKTKKTPIILMNTKYRYLFDNNHCNGIENNVSLNSNHELSDLDFSYMSCMPFEGEGVGPRTRT